MKLKKFKLLKVISRIWVRTNQKSFLKARYYRYFHEFPDLDNPKTFNEKVLWIALNTRKNLYTRCADKIEVKNYLDEKLGKKVADDIWCEKYGVWSTVDDIDFDLLPNEFVLKSNHSSGQIIICTEKKYLDVEKTKKEMKQWLKENLYDITGEWQYKNISPKIICEKLLDSNIVDYRIFCFSGKPEYVKVTQHNPMAKRGFDYAIYDMNWSELDIYKTKGYIKKEFSRPAEWGKIVEYAKCLSSEFNFVRVDFFSVEGKTYFAELTFTPSSGWEDFVSDDVAIKYGNLINIG